MSAGSMVLSPFGSNSSRIVNEAGSVNVEVSGFVTVTSTVPGACAGLIAVIDVALTTTTLVAAVPPIVTLAPVWKPLPVIVTWVPPRIEPMLGTMPEIVIDGAAVTVTLAERVSTQPFAFVTVACSVNVPTAPAVKVMLFVPVPAVIVPLVIDQLYDAPAPALATEATLPVVPVCTAPGAVIVAFGFGLTETVVTAEAALAQPLSVTTTV